MFMNEKSETLKRLYNLSKVTQLVQEELVFQTSLSNSRTFALIIYSSLKVLSDNRVFSPL